ncbi:MAG: LCP family protein [Patescibacteria group bacterium]
MANKKVPFYKKKGAKIAFLILGVFLLVILSFIAYLLAQGSKIFDSGWRLPFSDSDIKGVKEGRINLLVTGIGGANHPGGQLTDSLMVVSIKPDTKAMAMISIPRDLYVPISNRSTSVKINEILALGENEKRGSGAALLKQTLENTLGVPIHYYITLDFVGFEKFIDEVDGIDVGVDKAIYDPLYPDIKMEGYEPFYLKAGQQHLDGATALKYARSRQTSSDFDRAARQQKIIVAVKEKVLRLGFLANPKKILDVTTILSNHLRTDFAPNDMTAFAGIVKELDNSKTVSAVIANGENGPLIADSSSGTYLLLPRDKSFSDLKKIARDIFETKTAVSTEKKASIELLNGSSTAGQAGRLGEFLQSYDYTITNIANANEKHTKTVIYDYTKGQRQSTISFLLSKFNAEVKEKDKPDGNSADISVVIGDDYTGLRNTEAP